MNRIVILSECGFTRDGLVALLAPTYAVYSTSDPLACLAHLSQREHVSLVILSVSSRKGLDALTGLVLRIWKAQPHCKVLLDAGRISTPLLHFYFNYLHGCVGVIELAQPTLALRGCIAQVMDGLTVLSAEVIAGQYSLTPRERNVLLRVIRGERPTDIARTLQLSIKTVCHYKRAGLAKLGARNIQVLLSPGATLSPVPTLALNTFHDAGGTSAVTPTASAQHLAPCT